MKKTRWLSILLSLTLLLALLPTQAFTEEVTDGTKIACTQRSDCPAQVHEPNCPLRQEDGAVPEETDTKEPVSEEIGTGGTKPDETEPEETVSDGTAPDDTKSGETDPWENSGDQTTVPSSGLPEGISGVAPEETGTGDADSEKTDSDETVPDETSPGETSPGETAPEESHPTAAKQVLDLIGALPDPEEVTAENAEEVETRLRELLALYQALDGDEQDEIGEAILRAIELKSALEALNGEDSSEPMLLSTAANISYLDASGATKTCTSATVVDSSTITWSAGWYVVKDTVTISDRITVSGAVHLILADNGALNANAGIGVASGNSLTIYGQTKGTGKVIATGELYYAGIGGNKGVGDASDTSGNSGAITINGGTVTATGGDYAAGIGGGKGGIGIVTISGGTVDATGGGEGAGIGGGGNRSGGTTTVTISGGTVNATGGASGGAGIGTGAGLSSGVTVTISGGTVNATGGAHGGAGIGGGSINRGTVDVSVTGGFITAKGGAAKTSYSAGAAIGTGGQWNQSGTETGSFSNCMVLRQNGESGSAMTGQVYGSCTLTTDATAPAEATLTVPKGSTLTIASGKTLTNNGTIINNGTITNNGAIVNNGRIINNGTINGSGAITGNQPQVEADYQAYDAQTGTFQAKKEYAFLVAGSTGTGAVTWGAANTETWYVVSAQTALTILGRITVNGNVHLILADGCTLNANAGIGVADGNSLTIYGQSKGTGKLIAIGGSAGASSSGSAGIGGGSGGNSSGAITINGGTVEATGSSGSAGIGGGQGGSGSNITINGGTVTATGGASGAGIGGGQGGSGSNITVNGGFVTAVRGAAKTPFGAGAAIGSGGRVGPASTEIAESNFSNAVVLRQSGSDANLTGQVYGSARLTTDAKVPDDAVLNIPNGTTLTLAAGMTLTNNGKINVREEAAFYYSRVSGGSYGVLAGNDASYSEGIRYMDYEDAKGTFVERSVSSYTVMTASQTALGTADTVTWYVVDQNLTVSSRIIVTGDVRLILADNCTLTANGGITVAGTNSLTIYGQSGGTGELSAKGGASAAGIGGAQMGQANGPVTVNGGTVTATGGSPFGSGIGGVYAAGSNITINGGTVTATGGASAAGIGGWSGSNITIRGGTVTATGSDGGAGIGGGRGGSASGITITGGFVMAKGGAAKNSYGAGAAIGSGGTSGSSTGTELADTNFDNAVVLKQNGESGSTMTGQVYGAATLTTAAAIPGKAALIVPEGAVLTVGGGVTLTNSGAICMEGGSLQYGDPYGALTNDGSGTVCYLLTVNGGAATEGTVTYDGKTYAEANASVTVTPPDNKVGLTLNSFTITVNNETAQQGGAFRMPAGVTTVDISDVKYDNTPSYIVTIPAGVTIGGANSTATIGAESVNVAEGWNLNVELTGTGINGTDSDFTVALEGCETETLAYTVTGGEEDEAVSVGSTVLTVKGGTADSSGQAVLTFALTSSDAAIKYSGAYKGKVTFTVRVEEALAGNGAN